MKCLICNARMTMTRGDGWIIWACGDHYAELRSTAKKAKR